MRNLLLAMSILAVCTSCSKPVDPAADANLNAVIDLNNVDSVLPILTDDVVFMLPNEQPYVGKAAVRRLLEGHAADLLTPPNSKMQEFVVDGDMAYKRSSYTLPPASTADGSATGGTGWGLTVYRRDKSGKWQIARHARGVAQAVTS